MPKPPELLHADPRWHALLGDRAALEALAATWRAGAEVAAPVADMLAVARRLFVHSYFVYEFGLVAVVWALLALEAALRDCIETSESATLATLLDHARMRELLDAREAESLGAARELRNRLVHGRAHPAFTPGLVAELLASMHAAISNLYDRSGPARG